MELLTPSGVSVALALLVEAWPSLKARSQSVMVQKAVRESAMAVNASDRDLKDVVMYIVRNVAKIQSSDNLAMIFSVNLAAMGLKSADRVTYNCRERLCYKGLLLLTLEDDYETTIPCPYCTAGKKRSAQNSMARSSSCMDSEYLKQKNLLVRRAAQLYDVARRERIQTKEGFKYE